MDASFFLRLISNWYTYVPKKLLILVYIHGINKSGNGI